MGPLPRCKESVHRRWQHLGHLRWRKSDLYDPGSRALHRGQHEATSGDIVRLTNPPLRYRATGSWSQGLLGQRNPIRRSDGQDVVVEVVLRAMRRRRRLSGTEQDIAAGEGVEHEGEIVTGHA